MTYLVILSGGKRLRENGWSVLSLMVGLSAIVQAAGMSIVVSRVVDCDSATFLTACRHTYLITRTDSLSVGNSISLGSFAQSVGASVSSVPLRLFWLLRSCPLKGVMS